MMIKVWIVRHTPYITISTIPQQYFGYSYKIERLLIYRLLKDTTTEL